MLTGSGADLSDRDHYTIIHSAVVSKMPPCRFNKVLELITRLKNYEELVRCDNYCCYDHYPFLFCVYMQVCYPLIFLYSLFKKHNEHGKTALHLALESKLNVRAKSLLNLKKGNSWGKML